MNTVHALIVEDNHYFRQSLRAILEAEFPDMRVAEAIDGTQAVNKLAELQPAVVFTDIKLPGVNGLQLTEHIKSAYDEVFVVVMTSHDLPEYREAAYAAGADYFFRKDEMDAQQIATLLSLIAIR